MVGLEHQLTEARVRTLAIVSPLSDEALETQHDPLLSPLVWDLGHIAAYEDLWLVHRYAGEPLLEPELAAVYDAFETPRPVRGDQRLLDRQEALDYLTRVRTRALDVLEAKGPDPVLHEMVLQHEHQHNETMLQAIVRFGLEPGLERRPRPPAAGQHTGLEPVEVPAGGFLMGAPPSRFSYDNERPRHEVHVDAFRIGRTPVTNATLWELRGRQGDGDPDAPAMHVSWYEADEIARALGARLPTEAEWEKAATYDPATGETLDFPWGQEAPEPGDGRANLDQAALGPHPAGAHPAGASPCGALGMLGDVWEWTATKFAAYPGFRAHPYREYSEVFFGEDHRVLRGGSWATRCRVATPTFRNWDLPQRSQIFAGVRLAWDA